MPSAPPAAVISISELSTVAGASLRIMAPWPRGLEAHRVDAAVDFRNAQDLLDLLSRPALGEVNGLAAEAACLCEPLLVQVANDHCRGTQQVGARGSSEADGACTRNVDGGPHARRRR